uniref:Uncharacterized protein n=1 Tax=Rhizophora mucronata TaxID=61149 RepID=A0A2P2N7B7_RHIMU
MTCFCCKNSSLPDISFLMIFILLCTL